jgi:phosphate transport system substrate-binding protein
MKRSKARAIVFVIISLLIFASDAGARKKEPAKEPAKLSGNIIISGAFALYPLAVKWGDEFSKLNPDVVVDVSAGGAGKGMADALAGVVDIGMVSREIHSEEISKGAFSLAVAKDAVVVTVNEKNHALKELQAKGLKRETFIGIWITGKAKTWWDVLDTAKPFSLNVYTRSDACGAAEVWAGYLGKKQEDLQGIGVFGDPGIAQAVKLDELGIGYNNINFAYDPRTRKPVAGLAVVPIDLNGNGKIDTEENFYETVDQINKAIGEGRYPSPPARELYFVTRGKPVKKQVLAFLQWVLTDGQKFVADTGYVPLSAVKLESELSKLQPPAPAATPKK